MKIGDLSAPVTASKSDWLSGDSWLGFTPTNRSAEAGAGCQSTIQRQFGSGYVVEYITESFGKPNPGFERNPVYLENKERHRDVAGRLIAVHRLRASSRPLSEIIGPVEFSALQDMWDQGGDRTRWSVAFPIIESYMIDERPKARDVFLGGSYARLYAHSSATLRPLTVDEQTQLLNLDITPSRALNAWIGIEDEIAAAEASEIDPDCLAGISADLSGAALEGMTEERRAKVRKRAAWLAHKFILARQRTGQLCCDHCSFDPTTIINAASLRARSLLDVHHKSPLDEGSRYTTVRDFALLCPICHRLEHQLLRKGGSLFRLDKLTREFLAAEGV